MITREQLIETIVAELRKAVPISRSPGGKCLSVPVGVSNRHVHLSSPHLEALFGTGYQLRKRKDLSQPGQFACEEVLLVAGPKGAIEGVRVLGPVRKQTQVELSLTDCFKLGIPPVIRESGDLAGSPGVVLVGPRGSVVLDEGAIVARRHVHMLPAQAQEHGLKDGQNVCIVVSNGTRRLVFSDVILRVRDDFALEFHVDTDEANASGLKNGDIVKLTPAGVRGA
ncbi:MAG TPA: phosphate propanoyltransferase [Firmicutes bacterium]|nr:phosphate propanoyltransferase [Bacillota bacterium]